MMYSKVLEPWLPSAVFLILFLIVGSHTSKSWGNSILGLSINFIFPNPEMVILYVKASSVLISRGFADAFILKLPTVPEKLSGVFLGSFFTWIVNY